MRKITIVILLSLPFTFISCTKKYKGKVAITFYNGDKDTLLLKWEELLYLKYGDLQDPYSATLVSNVRTFKIINK